MDSFSFDPNFVSDFSYLQELNESPSEPFRAFGSQPCMSGFSVQTLDSPLHTYVSQSDAVLNNDYYANQLNQYAVAPSRSESNFISTEGEFRKYMRILDLLDSDDLVNIPLEELDVYLGTNETASDKLLFTEPNAHTVTHPPLQESSCGQAFDNFSQPLSRPVAKDRPLNTDNQQQVTDAPAEFEVPESTVSGESLTITPGEYYHRAYMRAYKKAYRAEMSSSADKVKAKQAGQVAGQAEIKRVKESSTSFSGDSLTITPGEAYNRAYRAEMSSSADKVKAKQAGQTAGQAERKRVKETSTPFSGDSLTITPEEACQRACQRAYQRAYRAEMSSSGDKEKAKQAGQAEIKRVKETSTPFSGDSLTITPEEACKRACHRAYQRAYRAEMSSSGDKEKAKQAGQAEIKLVKESFASFSAESLTITTGFQSSS